MLDDDRIASLVSLARLDVELSFRLAILGYLSCAVDLLPSTLG
jgi:hypothetical protein